METDRSRRRLIWVIGPLVVGLPTGLLVALTTAWFARRPDTTFGAAFLARLALLPFWLAMGAAWGALFSLAGQHWRRRYHPEYCHGCGYLLHGNVSGTCPECGKPLDDGNVAFVSRRQARNEKDTQL